jgi:hypothetical protein
MVSLPEQWNRDPFCNVRSQNLVKIARTNLGPLQFNPHNHKLFSKIHFSICLPYLFHSSKMKQKQLYCFFLHSKGPLRRFKVTTLVPNSENYGCRYRLSFHHSISVVLQLSKITKLKKKKIWKSASDVIYLDIIEMKSKVVFILI